MKSFNKVFQAVMNHCSKFEDIEFNTLEDMTLQGQVIFWGQPVVPREQSSAKHNFMCSLIHLIYKSGDVS